MSKKTKTPEKEEYNYVVEVEGHGDGDWEVRVDGALACMPYSDYQLLGRRKLDKLEDAGKVAQEIIAAFKAGAPVQSQYRVEFEVTGVYAIEVQADSEEHAVDKAKQEFRDDMELQDDYKLSLQDRRVLHGKDGIPEYKLRGVKSIERCDR